MNRFFFLTLCFIISYTLQAQSIQLSNIQIARDSFGVPHIFTKTNAEAAYGLAWAQAEDNFHDMQESLLAVNMMLSRVSGKDGALLDAVAFWADIEGIVNIQYDSAFSPEFKRIITAYTQAVNRYAELHPKEVRYKKVFPITEKDVIKGYVFNTILTSGVIYDLQRVFGNALDPITEAAIPTGSNGIAISPKYSTDGKTYLVSNSHQPVEGFAAWYEVQINTEEGWFFHGATFASGITPFVGVNKNLGWTHCLNYNDYSDVYKLEMHPTEKLNYKLDGEWLTLEKRVLKLKVKVAGIRIPIKRTFYWSKHGPVIKNKLGYYAFRFPAIMAIASAEQWYHMNNSQNLNAFKKTLEMQQMPSINITYADKDGNIMFVDNGLYPRRDTSYNWWNILPGNTSKTIWNDGFYSMDSVLTITNPTSGYLFNANGSGFHTTAKADRPNPIDYWFTNYQTGTTARHHRFHELFESYNTLSYEDLKTIKYDYKFSFPLRTRTIQNLDEIRHFKVEDYPDIAATIHHFKGWNGSTTKDNTRAAILSLSVQYILKYMIDQKAADINGTLPTQVYVDALRFSQKHLLKHFGRIDIPLGDLQKHVRGDRVESIGGIPESTTSMYTKPYKNGLYKTDVGETFILFATFNKDGLEKLESVNCFGASNHPDSPHYDDQMDLFLNHQLKPVAFDKSTILKKAIRVYSPR